MPDNDHFLPDTDTWIQSVQDDGYAYIAIKVDTDIAAVIDEARVLLLDKLGITPPEIVVTIVGSNALHLRCPLHEPADPFA